MHYDVFLKNRMPKHLHYGLKDDTFGRIGDIILVAQSPYYFSNNKPNPGAHGYDPAKTPEMRATFFAWGPAFKHQVYIPAFENVHVYPLIAKILGLSYHHPIDGNDSLAKKLLTLR